MDDIQKTEAAVARLVHDTDMDYRIREVFESVGDLKTDGVSALGLEYGELEPAITALYEAFDGRTISKPFEYCDCCITRAMAVHLQTSSVNRLDADDLWAIQSNVPSTAGTSEDLLYFTPRILEYAATKPCTLDLSWIYYSLQRDGAPRATGKEQSALRQFFHLIWEALRDRDPFHPLGITGVVLPTAVLSGEIGNYLDLWLGSPAVYRYLSSWGDDGSLGDLFWDKHSAQYGQVLQWFRNRKEILERDLAVLESSFEAPVVAESARMRLGQLSSA